jgi:MFS family permease
MESGSDGGCSHPCNSTREFDLSLDYYVDHKYLDTMKSNIDSGYVIKRVILMSFTSIWMGYYWVLYNELFYHIRNIYGIESTQNIDGIVHGLINGVFFFGTIIGSIISGCMGPKISTIKIFLWLDVLSVITVLLSLCQNIYMLLISRLFQGVISGINIVKVNQFIKEFCPKNHLSNMSILEGVFVLLGMIFGFGIVIPYTFSKSLVLNHW